MSKRQKPIPKDQYNSLSPIYRPIRERLWARYGVTLFDYVEAMYTDGATIGEGLFFIPKDSQGLIEALRQTGGFHWDDRRIFLYREAASHTIGEGYREYGIPSLHFEIAPGLCNVHLDMFGFVFRMPWGDVFTPDMFQHILDELKWADLVKDIRKHNQFAGEVLSRMHPRLPSSANKYELGVGVGVDVLRRFRENATKMTYVSLELTQDLKFTPCNPITCSLKDEFKLGGYKIMLSVQGTF